MSARIVPFDYQGQAVAFNADGWINATEAAARFGKVPNDWLRLPDTIAYLAALNRASGSSCGKIPHVKTSRARADRGDGTWLHPKLAAPFARWLSVDFAALRADSSLSVRLARHNEAMTRANALEAEAQGSVQ